MSQQVEMPQLNQQRRRLRNTLDPRFESQGSSEQSGLQGDCFTRRQRYILHQLAEGATDEQIARVMSLSARTVRNEVAAIRKVMGVESRFQAGVSYALWRVGVEPGAALMPARTG
ncbi:MAG: helix-turn-helix domain-containing protein [Propionibacteriaceae bacterium]